MPKTEAQMKADRYLELSEQMATALGAIYLNMQLAQSEDVPHNWNGRTVNVAPSDKCIPLVSRNDRRKNVTFINDGPSDLIISNEDFNVTSILQQYNGVSGQVLSVTLIRSGESFKLDSTGAVFAAPFSTTQSAIIRIAEAVFSTWRPDTSVPGIDADLWSGHALPGMEMTPNVGHAPIA